MKNKINKIMWVKKKFALIMLVLFILLPFISAMAYAWGIAYKDNSFVMRSGEAQNVSFMLQNYVGDEPKKIAVALEGNTEIASVSNKKDYYLLPPKTKDYEIVVRIAIPKPAKKSYKLNVNFISLPESGNVGLATAKVIPVNIEVSDGIIADDGNDAGDEDILDLRELYGNVDIGGNGDMDKGTGQDTARKNNISAENGKATGYAVSGASGASSMIDGGILAYAFFMAVAVIIMVILGIILVRVIKKRKKSRNKKIRGRKRSSGKK